MVLKVKKKKKEKEHFLSSHTFCGKRKAAITICSDHLSYPVYLWIKSYERGFCLQVNSHPTDPNANKQSQFFTPVSSTLYKPVTFIYKTMQSSSLLSKVHLLRLKKTPYKSHKNTDLCFLIQKSRFKDNIRNIHSSKLR